MGIVPRIPPCHPEEASPTKDPDGARRDLSRHPDKVTPRRGRDPSPRLRMTERGPILRRAGCPHPAAAVRGRKAGLARVSPRPSVRTGAPPFRQGGHFPQSQPRGGSAMTASFGALPKCRNTPATGRNSRWPASPWYARGYSTAYVAFMATKGMPFASAKRWASLPVSP